MAEEQQRCTGTNKDKTPCGKLALKNTARCMHHTIEDNGITPAPTPALLVVVEPRTVAKVETIATPGPSAGPVQVEGGTPYDDWSAMEIFNFVLNETNGRVTLDHRMPVPVLAARAVEALA
jgi:hypothetical protein